MGTSPVWAWWYTVSEDPNKHPFQCWHVCCAVSGDSRTDTFSSKVCPHHVIVTQLWRDLSKAVQVPGGWPLHKCHRTLCLHLSWGNCLHSISSALLAMSHGLLTVVRWNPRSYSKRKKYSITCGPTCCFYEPQALLLNRLRVGSTWLTR